MGRQSKSSDKVRLDAIALGLRKHFAGQTLYLAGKVVVVADLLATFPTLDAVVA